MSAPGNHEQVLKRRHLAGLVDAFLYTLRAGSIEAVEDQWGQVRTLAESLMQDLATNRALSSPGRPGRRLGAHEEESE